MTWTISDIIEKRIVICAGSGGVGKTTTAASLAVHAAVSGKKVIVITIDPAKRLGTALGLNALGHKPQSVTLPDGTRGSLVAMMLDQKQAFDEMVTRYSANPDTIRTILKNPLYKEISKSLSGAQEYASLSVLASLEANNDYDLIVVDTPPTTHTLDFIQAPEKLTRAAESKMIDWFRALHHKRTARVGFRGSYILRQISKIVGKGFIEKLSTFFVEFDAVLLGLKDTSSTILERLKYPDVSFVLICSPSSTSISDILEMYTHLEKAKIHVSGFIVNKCHQEKPMVASPAVIMELLSLLDPKINNPEVLSNILWNTAQIMTYVSKRNQMAVHQLTQSTQNQTPIKTIPLLDKDIHSIEDLLHFSQYLLQSTT